MTQQSKLNLDQILDEIHEIPKEPELKELIQIEHRRAELQRLYEGVAGCGCDDCQQLYQTIDLREYGSRVAYFGDFVLIAEKSRKNARADGSSGSLDSVSLPSPSKGEAVSEMLPDGGMLPRIMKHRGRPRKEGEVSRITRWRRRQRKE